MSKKETLSIVIAGIGGRMGRNILKLIKNNEQFSLLGGLEQQDSALVGKPLSVLSGDAGDEKLIISNPEDLLSGDEIVIDFTRPQATRSLLKIARKAGSRMVIGTTGLTSDDEKMLQESAKEIGIVYSANMSAGINLLAGLAAEATSCLGEDFDVEIMEMHHRFKEDAPSGTAKLLAGEIAKTRGRDLEEIERNGREGFVGERDSDEIGIHALRGGDVVGDHTIVFAGIGERIELTHRASSRETFARGALRAASYVSSRNNGLYDMGDVLGLK